MRRQAAVLALVTSTTGALLLGIGIFIDGLLRFAVLFLAVLLLLLALLLTSISMRPHPAMRRHSVVRIDLQGVKESAIAGARFKLPLGRTDVTVAVNKVATTSEGAEVLLARPGEEPERSSLPDDDVTFAGMVQGDKDSEVRLTIGEGWMQGYVLTDAGWWFIEPMRKFRNDSEWDEYVVYRTQDLRFKLEFGEDYKPRKVEGLRGGGGNEPGHRVNPIVPICMVHDENYSWQAGGRPYDHQRALINNVNGIYARIGCEFRISVFIWSVNWLTSTNADRMLDQVEDVVQSVWTNLRLVANRQARNTEVAHATTGKNLDGNTLGIAWQPGVYGLSQQQLLWVGGSGLFGGPPNLSFQNMMVAAHELGHNFNGSHDEADEWCVSHFIWCWDNVRTLMWPTFYDDNVSRFSEGDRNPGHNNAQRVSNNMATGRNVNF